MLVQVACVNRDGMERGEGGLLAPQRRQGLLAIGRQPPVQAFQIRSLGRPSASPTSDDQTKDRRAALLRVQ
jgi:hypothetical protein